jgi:hypothetical protein
MTNPVKLELTEDDFRAIIVLLGRGSTDDTFFVRANLILRLEQQGMPQLTPLPVEAPQTEQTA